MARHRQRTGRECVSQLLSVFQTYRRRATIMSELLCPMRHQLTRAWLVRERSKEVDSKAGGAGWRFSVSGNRARIMVVAACVLTLLGASTVIVGQAAQHGNDPRMRNDKARRPYASKSMFQKPLGDDAKGETAEIVGQCAMLKVGKRQLTRKLKVPNSSFVMKNIELGKSARSELRHRMIGGLKLRFLPKAEKRVCTKPEQLVEGLKAAAEGADGLSDPKNRKRFERVINAVVRYKTANALKRHSRCLRLPVKYNEPACFKTFPYYDEMLLPLKDYMCPKDFWNACGEWEEEDKTRDDVLTEATAV